VLKYQPIRIAHLCLRSALLQRGNALAALGREAEARESYQQILPLLVDEPRCARVDWERHSIYINIGNTFSRSGDYEAADEQYKLAEKLGTEHLTLDGGSQVDGKNMITHVKRARAFALRRAGKVDDAKALLKEVIAAKMTETVNEADKTPALEVES
jgi:tetratricopeptide (TPR) repeat protein